MNKNWYEYDLPDSEDEKAAEVHKEICKALWRWVEQTESLPSQIDRRDNVRLCCKIYSNRNEPGLELDSAGGSIADGFTYNQQPELRALIDSQHSILGKNRPKATVLTDGGDWEDQHTAGQLDDFLWREFQRTKFHQKASQMALYAEVTGDGFLHFFIDWERRAVMVEHVLVSEITVDERTVAPGEMPPMMARTRYVNREALKARYPDYTDEIEEAKMCLPFPGEPELPKEAGMVPVIECWYLPPAPGKKGRYALIAGEALLEYCDWEYDFFPFVNYKWKNPLTGFYGIGLVQEEFGAQAELDFIDDRISQSINLCAVPRVILPSGLEIDVNTITNEIGCVIQSTGPGQPQFEVGQALSPEVYNYRQSVAEGMQRRSGTSAMAVDGTPPNQVEAARAMREMADSQIQRLSSPTQRYEDANLDGAWLFLVLNKELYTSTPDDEDETEFEAENLPDGIKWDELELDRVNFPMEIEASSRLSMTPSSRLSAVIELKQYGVNVPDSVFMRLLNLPDLGEETKRMTAPVEYVEWVIGHLLKGNYIPQNGPLLAAHGPDVVERVLNASLDAEMRGAPKEILEVFRQWLTDAVELMTRGTQPPPAPTDPLAAVAGQVPGTPPPVDPNVPPPVDPAMMAMDPSMVPPVEPGAPVVPPTVL